MISNLECARKFPFSKDIRVTIRVLSIESVL